MKSVKGYITGGLAAGLLVAGAADAQTAEATFIRLGVQRSLEGPGGGPAPIEGAER